MSECTGRLPEFQECTGGPEFQECTGTGTAKLSPQTEFGICLAPPCCQQRLAEACKFLFLVSIK
eukprot:CCRYP_007704-RB/>CCRYP_007704-RB protein AED:0.60 eAED:0.67 QI:0/0/0/0.66/1/1/3/0/63